MNRFTLTIALIGTLFVLASFNYFKPDESILAGSWKVEEFVKGSEPIDVSTLNISLNCSVEGDLGQLSGRMRKDFFSGIYEVKSKKAIKLSNIIRTNYNRDENAQDFMESFQQVSQFRVVDDKLELLNQEKSIYITFKKD